MLQGDDVAEEFFRILSLSGGGARGIFQAELLRNYERQLRITTNSQFDLIAGTSVGGIIAAAVAMGISAERISQIFQENMMAVFRPERSRIRRGARYSFQTLKVKLAREFGDARIRDVPRKLILVAATLDRFQTKLITNIDEVRGGETDLSVVDAAMATAAAPTYFAPLTPQGKNQSYVDGGVWANSPSLIALLIATKVLKIPEQRVKVLHVGTGTTPTGILRTDYERLRPIGLSTIRTVLELIAACQVDGTRCIAEG
jgi:patatin-like phospholipase/acyl hydrolase